jgi:cytoskeleton protein RodZ
MFGSAGLDNTVMAPEIGDSLREARRRGGIELSEVEQATKIRVRYLRAMEEDRWELLPDPAYAPGFLRTYATFLGLDGDALVQEYRRGHEPVADTHPQGEPILLKAPGPRRLRLRPSVAILAGLAVAALLGVVVVLGLTGGSTNNGVHSAGAGRGASTQAGGTSAATTSTAERPAHASEVSLELRPTGTVWVCLVDDRGRAPVNGLTLAAGEARGPFRAGAFKITFGNGEVQMEVDGKPVRVPPVAEPLGYRITTQGVRQLDPAARPTCA